MQKTPFWLFLSQNGVFSNIIPSSKVFNGAYTKSGGLFGKGCKIHGAVGGAVTVVRYGPYDSEGNTVDVCSLTYCGAFHFAGAGSEKL